MKLDTVNVVILIVKVTCNLKHVLWLVLFSHNAFPKIDYL